MRWILSALLTFGCIHGFYAQPKNDSLWAVWKDPAQCDTCRLNAVNRLCINLHAVYSDSILSLARHVYDFAAKKQLKKAMAQSLFIRGVIVNNRGEFEKCLSYNQEAMKLDREINYEAGVARCLLNIGSCYLNWQKPDKAVPYFYASLRTFTRLNDKECLGAIFSNLSVIYRDAGQMDSAITMIKRSISMYQNLSKPFRLMHAHNTLGTIYYMQYRPDMAAVEHRKAISFGADGTNPYELSACYLNLAKDYTQMNDRHTASDIAGKGLEIARQINDSAAIGQALMIIANYVYAAKSAVDGIALGEESFQYLRSRRTINLATNQAVILAMWYAEQKQAEKAEEKYNFYFHNRHHSDNGDANEALLKQQLTYSHEKKQLLAKAAYDRQLAQLTAQGERETFRKNLWIAAISSLLLILALSAFFLYKNSRQKNIISSQKNHLLKQQLLVSQMNPHFIFNSLNAIQNFIFKQDNLQAGTYLKQFSDLIRMILDFSRKDHITLAEELTFLENYLRLQKLRFDNRLNYEIRIDEQLDPDSVLVAPMMAQPFIENAIEHGIFYKDGEGFLSVKISQRNNELIYEIEDDGVGLEQAAKMKQGVKMHKSLAVEITRERLETMSHGRNRIFSLEVIDNYLRGKKSSGVYVKFATPYLTL